MGGGACHPLCLCLIIAPVYRDAPDLDVSLCREYITGLFKAVCDLGDSLLGPRITGAGSEVNDLEVYLTFYVTSVHRHIRALVVYVFSSYGLCNHR